MAYQGIVNRLIAFAAAVPAGFLLAAYTRRDGNFVKEASACGVGEVAMGQLAATKGQHPAVREFGSRMVDDHAKAGEELKRIASAQGIEVEEVPAARQQRALLDLEALSGDAFDAAYIALQRREHDRAVSLFRREARWGGDPDLKNFAETTLPTLEAHRKMAYETHIGH